MYRTWEICGRFHHNLPFWSIVKMSQLCSNVWSGASRAVVRTVNAQGLAFSIFLFFLWLNTPELKDGSKQGLYRTVCSAEDVVGSLKINCYEVKTHLKMLGYWFLWTGAEHPCCIVGVSCSKTELN